MDEPAGPENPDVGPRPANPVGVPHADRRLEIEQRRAQVSALVLSHVPYRRIAEMLGVGRSTVGDDVRVIKEQWRARASESYSAIVAEENAKLDVLEQAWLPKALPFHPLATAEDVAAAEAATRVLDRIARQRARLLGLNQPTRVEVGLPVGPSVEQSIEEKAARGLRLVREVEGVEEVEAAAIEASSRIVDSEEAAG